MRSSARAAEAIGTSRLALALLNVLVMGLSMIPLIGVAGCAHSTGGGTQRASSKSSSDGGAGDDGAGATASGTWDWMFRSHDEGGNLVVEQEEWHLNQRGRTVDGYYDRVVTRISQDEQLFKCNVQGSFTRFTRVRVAGEMTDDASGKRVRLREVEYRTKPGPCDDGARILVSYEGEIDGGAMRLSIEDGKGAQTLNRRKPGERREAIAREAGFDGEEPAASTSQEPPARLSGRWEWSLRSIDAEGDERNERENWALVEDPDGEVHGSYDRWVTRTRGTGLFPCNGTDHFETETHYEIRGHRFGDRVTLTETAYNAKKDRCDNGLRRLDLYQGTISHGSNGVLILTWGTGSQVLHRSPDPPVETAPLTSSRAPR